MSSLIVLLPLQTATAQTDLAWVLTPDGQSAAAHGSSAAALLPAISGAGAEVIAIAPAAAISWHQVDLPRGTQTGSPRLRAVLEGMLEDRLLDEPESLHFALQAQPQAGMPVWVAVCGRAWLRAAVQVLEAAQRPAARIVPEFTPTGDMRLFALGDPDAASLVLAGSEGVMLMPLSPAAMALLPGLSEDTPCLAEPGVAALAEQVLSRKVPLQQAPQRWLQAARSPWDLAQMEFASSSRARTLKKMGAGWAQVLGAPQWRPLRWAAVLLLALNLVGLNAWAWKERSTLQAKRDAVQRSLTQTFPQVKVIVDAPVQMEKEVALLRQASGATSSRDLEAMLGALAMAAGQESLTGIEYANGSLRVRGMSAGASTSGAVTASLRGAGYNAVLQGDTLVITEGVAP